MLSKYFLPFCGLSFHSLDRIFGCTTCFNLIKNISSSFFLSLFVLLVSINHCQIQSHEDCPLCFLLRVLSFSAPMFRVLTHFELIFECGVKQLHSFACGHSNFPSIVSWKDCPFPLNILASLSKAIDNICEGFLLGSLFYSHGPYVWFYASFTLFWLLYLCSKILKSGV